MVTPNHPFWLKGEYEGLNNEIDTTWAKPGWYDAKDLSKGMILELCDGFDVEVSMVRAVHGMLEPGKGWLQANPEYDEGWVIDLTGDAPAIEYDETLRPLVRYEDGYEEAEHLRYDDADYLYPTGTNTCYPMLLQRFLY